MKQSRPSAHCRLELAKACKARLLLASTARVNASKPAQHGRLLMGQAMHAADLEKSLRQTAWVTGSDVRSWFRVQGLRVQWQKTADGRTWRLASNPVLAKQSAWGWNWKQCSCSAPPPGLGTLLDGRKTAR